VTAPPHDEPTFAAVVLDRLHALEAENARLRRITATQGIWLRIFEAHRHLPVPRPELTPAQIDSITADVLAQCKEQG
jgi:hypothetical protein